MTLRTWGLVGVVACHAVAASPVWASEPAVPAARSGDQVATAQPRDALGPEFLTSPRPRPSGPAALDGSVAAQSEQCQWLGTRIISLLSRDDAMTAKDFSPFYDRFGCPEAHLSRAFGCVVGGGGAVQGEELASRVDRCWADPVANARAADLLGDAEPTVLDEDAKQPAGGT